MADIDSMATPLNKLPPPVLTSRTDGPGLETGNPSYQEILNKMEMSGGQQQQLPPSVPSSYAQQQQQPPLPMQFQGPPPQPPQSPLPQYYQDPTPPQYYQDPTPPPLQYYTPPPPLSVTQKHKKKSKASSPLLSVQTINHPHVWIVAVLVFLTTIYGIPKVRAQFPSMIDPVTGTTKWVGVIGVSMLAALMFAIARKFV